MVQSGLLQGVAESDLATLSMGSCDAISQTLTSGCQRQVKLPGLSSSHKLDAETSWRNNKNVVLLMTSSVFWVAAPLEFFMKKELVMSQNDATCVTPFEK